MNPDITTVNAEDIGTVQPVKLSNPQPVTPSSQFVAGLEPVVKASGEDVYKKLQEKEKSRDDVFSNILKIGDQDSQGIFNTAFNEQGGDETLKRLQDEQLKLTTLQNKFRTAAQRTSGAEGQSQAFEGVQLNELSRQEAVEVGNQALVVQALQGNLATARQIALDTTRFASEDRAANLNALIAQYDALDGQVGREEQKVLEIERRKAEAERDALIRAQKAVDTAITSGAASVEEMQQLISPNLTDEEKQSIAQNIVARGAGEDRRMSIEDRALNRANIQSQMSARAEGLALDRQKFALDSRVKLLELAEKGDKNAIAQLGYDPNNTPDKQSQKQAAQDSAFKELSKINSLVGNKLGISSSAGTVQSPILARMLGMGAAGTLAGGAAGSVVPGAGTVAGGALGLVTGLATGAVTGANAKREKENFLGQLDFLLSGDSFDKFRELKASGVTFGQTTEKEWDAVRKAANELESFAKRDGDGKLTGFNGSEAQLQTMLTEYQAKTQKFATSFIDETNASDFLDPETDSEIDAIYGTSTQAFDPASFY